MAITLDGPSKVSMDCTEIDEGYKVRYTPLLPGEYYMSIKYNNMHIVGSPFKIVCTGRRYDLTSWKSFGILINFFSY